MNCSGVYIWKYKGIYLYVGKSKNVFNRIKDEYCNGSINSKALEFIRNLPELEIEIHFCEESELDKMEAYYINKYNTLAEGFNIQPNNYDFKKNRQTEKRIRYGDVKKRIICLNDGEIYSNYSEAKNHYNISTSSDVARVCNGYQDIVNGKRFCYLSDIKTLKFLPKSLLAKIFKKMQEDEWDWIYDNTNFFDTMAYLQERTDWETRWVASRKKERAKHKGLSKKSGCKFETKLTIIYE